MTTQLVRFTQWVKEVPQRCYTSLMGLLTEPAGLRESYDAQPGNKAVGVDGVRKADYAEGVDDRLADLVGRLRRLAYRPHPARRVYIPKANGKQRPLGIPSFEDRIVQHRLSGILQAIWEPEFSDASFGFRPHRNAHQALARLKDIITARGTQWIVEADIKGFFDHVSHDWLMHFLQQRIGDPNLLRIVRQVMGVRNGGQVLQSSTSPQIHFNHTLRDHVQCHHTSMTVIRIHRHSSYRFAAIRSEIGLQVSMCANASTGYSPAVLHSDRYSHHATLLLSGRCS